MEFFKNRIFINIALAFLVLVGGFGLSKYLKENAPKAEKKAQEKKSIAVDTIKTKIEENRVAISTNSTIKAKEESLIKPQVSGAVESVSERLIPGFFVKKGEVLLKIEDDVYKNNLLKAEAALESAEANYKMELGEQLVAKKEYELLGRELKGEDRSLALREPQYIKVSAEVKSAKSNLENAKRDLKNTEIVAPYDGVIVSKNISTGNYVNTSSELFKIVSAESFWIEAEVDNRYLKYLKSKNSDKVGSKVLIYPDSSENKIYREGEILSFVPQVESASQKTKIVIEVSDPLSIKDKKQPKIHLNSFVKLKIEGEGISESVKLPWSLLRSGESTWVLKDNSELEIRKLDILYEGEEALIVKGLKDGEEIITTNLGSPANGTKVTKKGDKQNSDGQNSKKRAE